MHASRHITTQTGKRQRALVRQRRIFRTPDSAEMLSKRCYRRRFWSMLRHWSNDIGKRRSKWYSARGHL